MTRWVEFNSAQQVAEAAADVIEQQASKAIRQRGEFKLVLAGGTTPRSCYQILAGRDLEWDRWKLFYGDERCLPVDDAERNHRMVEETGLAHKVLHHYIIPAELGSTIGAESYQELIQSQLPFDLVMLGMGEDGHTASLFPGQELHCEEPKTQVVAVHNSPKAPAERISLSCSALQDCQLMLALVTGESKKPALHQWLQGEMLPLSRVADLSYATVFVEASLLP